VVGAVLVAAAAAAAVVAVVGSRDDEGPTATTETVVSGIPQDGMALGRGDAPVTLVEYADLQCPYCAQFALGALPTLVERYVRPGKLRIEFRGLSFIGPDSHKALEFVQAASDEDHAWDVIDLLYQSQGTENTGWVTDELLDQIAAAAGLDGEELRSRADDPEIQNRIEQTAAEASTRGVESTPTFLLGPTGGALNPLVVQSLDPQEFTAAIDEELAAS
jgi:protein-disulfide isomerase